MLTDTQVQVLGAVNDHCEIHGAWTVKPVELPPLLAELDLPTGELLTALRELAALGLIEGVPVAEAGYPVVVCGLTGEGRQELP